MKIGELELSEALQIFNAYRGKVVAEDTLINQRITWMLAAEAILFAIWGALALPNRTVQLGTWVIPLALVIVSLFGITVAWISRISLNAAKDEIKDIKSKYEIAHNALFNSNHLIPRLHSGKEIFKRGFIFARLVPWIIMTLHAGAIIYTLAAYLMTPAAGPGSAMPISHGAAAKMSEPYRPAPNRLAPNASMAMPSASQDSRSFEEIAQPRTGN